MLVLQKGSTKIITSIILVSLLLSTGCITNYTKEIKSDECPSGYYKIDSYCDGDVDNVIYYTTPKSSVTFHSPKGVPISEVTRLKKYFLYNNLSIRVAMINYNMGGFETFDEYIEKLVYPNLTALKYNESKEENVEGETINYKISSIDIKGYGIYFGEEGWLYEIELLYEKHPGLGFLGKTYLFRLDDPYVMQLVVTGTKNDFDEGYTGILPYLNRLEIEVKG